MICLTSKKRGSGLFLFVGIIIVLLVLGSGLLIYLHIGGKPVLSISTKIENNGNEVSRGNNLIVSSNIKTDGSQEVSLKYEIMPISKDEVIWEKENEMEEVKDSSDFEESISVEFLPAGTYRLKISASNDGAISASYSTFIVKEILAGKTDDLVKNPVQEENVETNTDKILENASFDENDIDEPENSILANGNENSDSCTDLMDQNKKDGCLNYLALKEENVELCLTISYVAIRDGCILKFAIDDPSLCMKISDDYQREVCEKMAGKNGQQ